MTLNQLEYVVAVDTYGSFSRAAEKCYVTQPALSTQIHRLEEELGVILFDRSKKPIQATPIGEEIIALARENLRSMERIKELIQESKNEIKGHLRVGVLPTLAPYLVPLFITSFLKKYPRVSLSVEEFVSEQIIRKLKQNILDVGILVTPLHDPAITEMPLFYETFVAYISENHPLSHYKTVALADLNVNEMLLLSEGHCFREQVVNICPESRDNDYAPQLRFESGTLETLKRLVEQGHGYTLLPELSVRQIPEIFHHLIKEFQKPKPVREVSLVMHRSIVKRNLIQALKNEILDSIPDSLKDRSRGEIVQWR